jgi:hypothetical protein
MEKRVYLKEGISFQDATSSVENSSQRLHWRIVVSILGGLVVLVLVGLYWLGASSRKSVSSVAVLVTPTAVLLPTEAASPSAVLSASISAVETEGLSRQALSVAILNGSGEKGVAKGVSDALRGLGYRVVSVGNADSYAYRNITVLVKPSQGNYAQLLRGDIMQSLHVASVSASLSDTIAGEAEVIVGK